MNIYDHAMELSSTISGHACVSGNQVNLWWYKSLVNLPLNNYVVTLPATRFGIVVVYNVSRLFTWFHQQDGQDAKIFISGSVVR